MQLNKGQFFVRKGKKTVELKGLEKELYILNRFPNSKEAIAINFKNDLILDINGLKGILRNDIYISVFYLINKGFYDSEIFDASNSAAKISDISDMLIMLTANKLAAKKFKIERGNNEV
jgi:hypothetical protein